MIRISRLQAFTNEGDLLLSSFDLEVPSQTVVGVFGPNGSGKSTLLKSISGNRNTGRQTGEVRIAGLPMEPFLTAREKAKQILYLGSDFKSPFDLTVRELFEMGVEAFRGGFWPGVHSEGRERIESVVNSLGVASFLSRSFQTLSDGEKQLMMFARALIQAPKVLVLDETFSKLDLDRLISVTGVIRAWAECGMTFLIASHDLNFLSEISDQLLLMKKGSLMAAGPVDSVLTDSNLRDLFTKVVPHVVLSPESGKRKILY